MGKGDMRTRRGKIVRRTHGNVRPKHALKKPSGPSAPRSAPPGK
jgi:ribosomal small subunit protein bTHX